MKVENKAVIVKLLTVQIDASITSILPNSEAIVYNPINPTEYLTIDLSAEVGEASRGENFPPGLPFNNFSRPYVSQSNNIKVLSFSGKIVLLAKTNLDNSNSLTPQYKQFTYFNEKVF